MNKFATAQTAHCQGNAAVSLLHVLYYCKLQRNLFEFVIRRSVIVEVSVENYEATLLYLHGNEISNRMTSMATGF